MRKFQEVIEGKNIWFYTDRLRIINPINGQINEEDAVIIFFNLKESDGLIFGEIIRDENNIPYVFNTEEEALEFGRKYVKSKFQ